MVRMHRMKRVGWEWERSNQVIELSVQIKILADQRTYFGLFSALKLPVFLVFPATVVYDSLSDTSVVVLECPAR